LSRPGSPADTSQPIDLLSGPERVVAREAGFAVKVLRPGDGGAVVPPGQGQVLIGLRGEAELTELGGDEGKVVMTQRAGRTERIGVGTLFKIPNDARWTLRGLGASVLALSTSVAREVDRRQELLPMARRRQHMAPLLLFANEAVRVELVAARGRLPFRGWVPYDHVGPVVEIAVILDGSFRARAGDVDAVLRAGQLLHIAAGVPHNFAARGRGTSVGLVISAVMHRRDVDEPLDRRVVRGFTPFGR